MTTPQRTSHQETNTQGTRVRLRVNPAACSGHGACAEILPELITLDEWGYPLLYDGPVPGGLLRQARRAVRDCPALALRLSGETTLSEETQKFPRRAA